MAFLSVATKQGGLFYISISMIEYFCSPLKVRRYILFLVTCVTGPGDIRHGVQACAVSRHAAFLATHALIHDHCDQLK